MDGAVGYWDADLETGLVTIGPEGAGIGPLRLPAGAVPLATLSGSLHPEDAGRFLETALAWAQGPSPVFRHVFRVGDGGAWVWIELTGRKHADNRKLSGVWADVTDQKMSEARKDEAVSRIHQFAAAASHDLIGPLRHIAMYGDLLISDFGTGATQEKRQMLQAIADKARNLQVLTKRLIAFSTGTAAPEFQTVPVERVLANVLGRLAAEIGEVDAVVTTGNLPAVTGDPVLIEKVFENLLRNALEWRGGRRPAIVIDGRVKGGLASIMVTDNGAGVDPRYTGRIFDAFWSLPRPGAGKGAGLGLAVCKTIMNALGGEITLSSSSPDGSVFEIVLPSAG